MHCNHIIQCLDQWRSNSTVGESILGTISFNRCLLVWDSYQCHMMKSVKEALNQISVHQVIVPGGCTKYLQAPDIVGTNCSRMASGVQEYTEATNMRCDYHQEKWLWNGCWQPGHGSLQMWLLNRSSPVDWNLQLMALKIQRFIASRKVNRVK